jgi:hypothetical protein
MTEEEFLRRWDRHIAAANENLTEMRELNARGNENMVELREHMARGNILWAENREALSELRQSIDDMRVELRQTSLRGQRVAEQFATEVRMARRERLEEGPKTRAILDDLLAESRAGRDAMFRILDELRGGPGPAAAGA